MDEYDKIFKITERVGGDKDISDITVSLLPDGSPGVEIIISNKPYVISFDKAKEIANKLLKVIK